MTPMSALTPMPTPTPIPTFAVLVSPLEEGAGDASNLSNACVKSEDVGAVIEDVEAGTVIDGIVVYTAMIAPIDM